MTAANFNKLLSPLQLGNLTLKNRIILASLTRSRGLVPNDVMKEYYIQRSNAGLILTEATLITQQGSEWDQAPGIWSEEQVEAWKKITDAVHEVGGLMFCQLWHIGRVAHPEAPLQKATGKPVPAPSAIAARGGEHFRHLGIKDAKYEVPTTIEDPREIIMDYRRAAENAKRAGFDGVELHAANGYLVHQFIENHSNQRSDNYGGSIENRNRFALEVLEQLIDVWGPKSVGIKLSPAGGYNDMGLEDPDHVKAQYTPLIEKINEMNIAYIQLMQFGPDLDPQFDGPGKWRGVEMEIIGTFRPLITNVELLANLNYTPESAEADIAQGKISAVVFGRKFINNPDLALRIAQGVPLNTEFKSGMYGIVDGDPRAGYTDYPVAVHV